MLLTGRFETGIVSLALRAQGISSLEPEAGAVNERHVVRENRYVFSVVFVFLSVVPML